MELYQKSDQPNCRSESTRPYDLSMPRIAAKSRWSPETIEVTDDEKSASLTPEINVVDDSNSNNIIDERITYNDRNGYPSLTNQEAISAANNSAFRPYNPHNYFRQPIIPTLIPPPFTSFYDYGSRFTANPYNTWGPHPQSSYQGNFMNPSPSGLKLKPSNHELGQSSYQKFIENEFESYNSNFEKNVSFYQRNQPVEENLQNRNFSFSAERNFTENLQSFQSNSHFNGIVGCVPKHAIHRGGACHPPPLEPIRNNLPSLSLIPNSSNKLRLKNQSELLCDSSQQARPKSYGQMSSQSYGQEPPKAYGRIPFTCHSKPYSDDSQLRVNSNQTLEITPEDRTPLIEFVKRGLIRRFNEKRQEEELNAGKRKRLCCRTPSVDPCPCISRTTSTSSIPQSSASTHRLAVYSHSSNKQTSVNYTKNNIDLDHTYHKGTKESKAITSDTGKEEQEQLFSSKCCSFEPKIIPQRRQLKRCSFCLNHNLTILVRGHKGKCLFKECKCNSCDITRNRQLHVMREHRIVKERAKSEILIIETPEEPERYNSPNQ